MPSCGSPTFIDLFSGAGGLSLGLSNAGWTGLLGVDNWHDAVTTYRANIKSHPVLEADLTTLESSDLTKAAGQKPDWIVGGPPCQGFSTVGKRDRSDPRNQLVWAFARYVGQLRPRHFLIENVSGVRDHNFVGEISSLFQGLGYSVSSFILSSADFGVPQLRRRIFFVGGLGRSLIAPPAPSHPPQQYVSVQAAIGDLPVLGSGESASEYSARPTSPYQALMRNGSRDLSGHDASRHPSYLLEAISYIPDGGNRQHIPDRLQPKSGFHNSYSRLDSRKPAVAITQNMGKPSGTRCIHPFQDRGLTAREGARLQSFPDTFHFSAGKTSQRRQIANAVPPILAKAMAVHLESDLNWTSQSDHSHSLPHGRLHGAQRA